jgi:ribosome maturation factor RimP
MSRTPLHQRLISIVEPVCQAAGYELVELRFVLEQGGWTLRVAVDLPLDEHTSSDEVPSDRVSLQDCEGLSRELSAVLDVEDPIPQAFHLEVSSPGIDRPLRTAAHFRHFVGSEAKIQLAVPMHTPSGDRRNFKGIIESVEDAAASAPGGDEGTVRISCDGSAFDLAIADIDHAKLVPDWDAVMKGRSGVGKAGDRQAGKPGKPGGHGRSGRPDRHAHHAPADAQADADNKEQG